MTKRFLRQWAVPLIIAVFVTSCGEDEKSEPAPLIEANFNYELGDDGLTVQFTNKSIGAESFSWSFGDDATSTEQNPEHTYEPGTYSVQLTAVAEDGRTSKHTKEIIIEEPNTQLKKLTGETSKTWKLLRDVSTGRYPILIGAQNSTTIHWAFGGATRLDERPCALNDEYTFTLDGVFQYETNGDVFADAGDFGPWSNDIGSLCVESTDANFLGKEGVDISAWNDGTHAFEYNTGTSKLTVTGNGAFIGLQKVGTSAEVTTPQQSVTYNVTKLYDGQVDTLILDVLHGEANYWRFVLVHYDDPSMEPAMPGEEEPNEGCVEDAAEEVEGSQGIALTLETATSAFGGFGGVTGGRTANPHVNDGNMSCYVNQYNRATAGCETWGGVAIGLPSAIDFAATTKKKFTLKVYAESKLTDAVLRLEKLAHPDTEPSQERTATITAAGEWQTLTFDFSDVTDPLTFKNIVLYFDRGVCGENVVYYFDDLTQID